MSLFEIDLKWKYSSMFINFGGAIPQTSTHKAWKEVWTYRVAWMNFK